MRFAQIRKMDISNGEGIGVSLFTAYCPYHCNGCHNSSIWSPNSGEEYTKETETKILSLLDQPYVTRLSILGGEPLLPQNVEQLYGLAYQARYTYNVKIWLWTGTTLESILFLLDNLDNNPDKKFASLGWDEESKGYLRGLLRMTDYLVDGRFIQEQKDLTLQWRGSSNQRILDCKKSMKQFKPISADI